MAKPNQTFRLRKFLFDTHRWAGVVCALALLVIAVSGGLLLVKKDFDSLQPPTQKGQAGELNEFISVEQLVAVVLAEDHEAFQRFEDISRVDFRPGKRVHKVQSKHGHWEIQVDAVNGQILSVAQRKSDWIEALHDGSWFGDWYHDFGMPVVAVVLIVLTGSGVYLWVVPFFRRRGRRR